MRVCFGSLCFSSRLNNSAVDEEAAHHTVTSNGGSHVISKMATIGELQALLVQKDERIEELTRQIQSFDREVMREQRLQDLQQQLQIREIEISDLRSQLDKFQSVIRVQNPTSPKGMRPRKQRAGISAEPQSEASILELSKQTFTVHPKDER
uniref:Uncharacterized protein LOC114336690 isoform X1 n=1 Tax=Diabrotica virgifera virgifera TaxID=50390 RepID=A0A6P7GD68_DIAVI